MTGPETRPPFLRPGVRAHLGAALRLIWLALRHSGTALRLAVGQILAGLVAIVVIFWEWGWKPLADLLGRLAKLRPIARLEEVIRSLPPYAALAVFVLPSLLLFPLKLVALYLLAQGHKIAAAALFIGAKVVGTAFLARIFMLTQAALMRLGWFKRTYDGVMPLKAALLAWARESAVWRTGRVFKARAKALAAPWMARARAMAAAIRARLPGRRTAAAPPPADTGGSGQRG